MLPSDSDERWALYLAGQLTGSDAESFERELETAPDETRAAFARMNDAAGLLTMALTPRREAPATARAAIMAAAGIERGIPVPAPAPAPAPPVAAALDKFIYLLNDEGWNEPILPGIRIKPLFSNPAGGHRAFLLELQPGTQLPEHPHAGYEECLILRGDLVNEGVRLGPGDYVRASPSTQHLEVFSEQGCLCIVIASAA